MNIRVLNFFDIRPSESGKALWFFLLMFAISLFYTLGSTIGDTLFINKVGVNRLDKMLPWYYIGVAIATVSVTWAVDWFLDRKQKVYLFLVLELLFAASVFLMYWGLSYTDEEWIYFALMVWLEVIGLISLSIFFSFMGDFFTSRDARRLYGFINGGYPLGNLLMGFGVQPLLLFMSTEDLLVICGLLLIAIAFIPLYIHQRETTIVDRTEERQLDTSAPLSKVLGHPFVIIIFLMMTADLLYFVFTDFELKVLAAEAFDKNELAIFFGLLYGTVGLIQIFVQFGLVSILLKKVGIINSLFINASLALIAMFTFILHPTLAIIAFANIARYTFSETLDIPARELLYFPLAGRLRERAQTLANGMLAPIAQGLGGVALLVIIPLLPSNTGIGFIAAAFAIIWIISIYFLSPRYQKSLEDSLINWDFNPENIDRLLEQKNSRDIFKRLMDQNCYAEIIALLNFVPSHSELDFREDFYALLQVDDTPTQIKVLELIKNNPTNIDAEQIKPLLDSHNEELAALAVEVVCMLLKEDAMDSIAPYFDSKSIDIRVAARASLALHGGLDAALSIFPKLKEDLNGPIAARVEAVKVITRMNYPGATRVLRSLLSGAEVRLKREVLGALSRLRDPSIVPDLLPMILIPSLEENVTMAMERMPPDAAIHIVNFINTTPLDTLHRIRMIRLLGKFPHPDAEAFLTKHYQEETNPIQRINCLGAMQDLNELGGFSGGSDWVNDEIDWALSNFEETQRAVGSCRKSDVRFRDLLLDHYRYQLEILFGLINLFYSEDGLERAGLQFFSGDPVQLANSLELFDVNLDRTHKAMIMPVLNFYLEAPVIEGLTLSVLWKKELPADPFLRMIRIYYLFAKTPPGARKMENENKNMLGVLSIVSFLKKVELFSEIPANYLIPIAEMMKHKTVFAGEVLFEKGDMGDCLYLIQKGTIEILVENNRVIPLKAGEAIGDMALIDGEPRSATARVSEDSRLLQLRSYDFNRLLLSYPIIAKSLLRILSKRLRVANTRR